MEDNHLELYYPREGTPSMQLGVRWAASFVPNQRLPYKLVDILHDFKGMHGLSGNFFYYQFFRKTQATLYLTGEGAPWRHHL